MYCDSKSKSNAFNFIQSVHIISAGFKFSFRQFLCDVSNFVAVRLDLNYSICVHELVIIILLNYIYLFNDFIFNVFIQCIC